MSYNKKTNRTENIRRSIKNFPTGPGLYFMKDPSEKVLYIGKAKNLRVRAASYFRTQTELAASRGPKIIEMLKKVSKIDYLETETEVDALLTEARLIKDIRPPYNTELLDDKTFPYLEITTSDDFPAIYLTRKPRYKGSKLFGPFANSKDLRRVITELQKIFKFRTCKLNIAEKDTKRRFFRPCILYSIHQCTAPCGAKIDKKKYENSIRDLVRFLNSKRSAVLRQLKKQMNEASEKKQYEEAILLRDRIRLIERLDRRGTPSESLQPEIFAAEPQQALHKLQKIFKTDEPIRTIEGIDTAHLAGTEAVGSLVKFIDGRPFKNGYRKYRIKTAKTIDDCAMIAEVVQRRYKYAVTGREIWPDLILIDGGLGQLHAADKALQRMNAPEINIAALAKRNEQLYLKGKTTPLNLSRHSDALKLLQYVRDEAHRFAQNYHHILRRKKMFDEKS